MKEKAKARLVDFLLINAGCMIYAMAFVFFLDPNRLVPGGVSGLAMILSHTVGYLGTGTIIIILNIPLMIVGAVKFGRSFFASTIYATLVSSLVIDIGESFVTHNRPLTENLLLAALAGGVLLAIGLGLIFRAGGCTGGSDIVAKLLRLKYKHIKTGQIFLILDSSVVCLSAFCFKDIDVALYAALGLVVEMFVFDAVIYGSDSAKLVYIISDKSEEITKRLLNELEIGVTYLDGEGAYTGTYKRVIMCAAHKQVYPKIREIITQTDELAFMIVSPAQQIFGEGFRNHKSEDL